MRILKGLLKGGVFNQVGVFSFLVCAPVMALSDESGRQIAAKAAQALIATFRNDTSISNAEIAIPAKFHKKTLSFENWPHARPPVVAAYLHKKNGQEELRFYLDHTLDFNQSELELKMVDAKAKDLDMNRVATLKIPLKKNKEGDYVATLEKTVDSEGVFIKGAAYLIRTVTPVRQIEDWFPIYFDSKNSRVLFPVAKSGLKEVSSVQKKCDSHDEWSGAGYAYCLTDVFIQRWAR